MEKLKTLENMENWMPQAFYPDLLNEPWALMVSSKDSGSPPEDEGYYAHSELREEAIKWIKELEYDQEILAIIESESSIDEVHIKQGNEIGRKWCKLLNVDKITRSHLIVLSQGLKYVFNIKSEDLK